MKDYQDKWLKIDNELDLSNFLAFLELVLRKPKERNSNILEFMGCLDFKSQKVKKSKLMWKWKLDDNLYKSYNLLYIFLVNL